MTKRGCKKKAHLDQKHDGHDEQRATVGVKARGHAEIDKAHCRAAKGEQRGGRGERVHDLRVGESKQRKAHARARMRHNADGTQRHGDADGRVEQQSNECERNHGANGGGSIDRVHPRRVRGARALRTVSADSQQRKRARKGGAERNGRCGTASAARGQGGIGCGCQNERRRRGSR